MKTALLLTSSADTQRLLADLCGQNTNFVLVPPPVDPTRAAFDALFGTWLRLVDAVVLDAAALGEPARWAIESLQAVRLDNHQGVVVRATAAQQLLFTFQPAWMVVSDRASFEELKQSLGHFFELREAQAKLKRAEAVIARQRQTTASQPGTIVAPKPVPAATAHVGPAESYRYRDALKQISRVLSEPRFGGDERALLAEFLRPLRELLCLGKVAIYTRTFEADLFGGKSGLAGSQLTLAVSTGIARQVVEHLGLSVEEGIGGYLAREAKILRRAEQADPLALDHDAQIAREFELLGTEVAVPIVGSDELIGVLTFSGKITGEPLTNDDLELAYDLMRQLAHSIRNQQLLDQIARHQRFLSEVLANVTSGVVIIGHDNRVLSLNPAARRLLDLGTDELDGLSANRLPALVADVLFEALQTGSEIRQREVTLPRTGRPLSVSATPFATSFGDGRNGSETVAAVGLIEDLTQLKLQETQARRLADQEFFTRLAFRMSHELKNSLVSIKIFAQLLPERYGEKEFRDQFSSVVANEVNRVDVLVNNLTFFAHPLELVCEELVLSDLIETCLGNVAHEFARKKVAMVMGVGEKPPESATGVPVVTAKKNFGHKSVRLTADKIRLMQAVEHVLRNAVQSMPGGGRLVISTTDAQPADFGNGELPDGGGVRIEVLDTGEGIALENLKRVTEPFVTTRNVGVGLGMTIVKKIIDRHGGRLEIDSMLGRGTTVTFVLPLKTPLNPVVAGAMRHADGLSEADANGGSGTQSNRLTGRSGTERGAPTQT